MAMCGIIGYVGWRRSAQVLMEGLERLEYRGYDSAGLAWFEGDRVQRVRAVGNLASLRTALHDKRRLSSAALAERRLAGNPTGGATATLERQLGIGHTRWATHGAVTERNAHPHVDARGRVWIVLNGIIENHLELRARLARRGIACDSETDAEVVAQMLGLMYTGDLAQTVAETMHLFQGQYALVAMASEEPDLLVAVRQGAPLTIGIGQGEQFIASSIAAFLPHTREVAVPQDGEIAVLRADEVVLLDAAGEAHPPSVTSAGWDPERIEKDGYETFMLKEIHEQGAAVRATVQSAMAQIQDAARTVLSTQRIAALERVIVVACGTSYHAGLAGKLALERWARVPVEVDVASEFRYRDPILNQNTLVVAITQSGETADTLAAMRLARAHGAPVLVITNAPGSQATRDADGVLFTQAGIEMGVAATKTFVAQVAMLYMVALQVATVRRRLPSEMVGWLAEELQSLGDRIDELIATVDEPVATLARDLAGSQFFLYLGRLTGLPVALEGALKLKEISYVPTDAYAAGEMKHGPIALLSPQTPVICVATEVNVLPKLLANMAEVKARHAQVLAVAAEGFTEVNEYADHVVYVPRTDPLLEVLLAIVPLQLFAYHLARARSLSVDQPRNLAKTVTVE